MQALQWDGSSLAINAVPLPERSPGEALVRVLVAGICNTDLEIMRGYHGFKGTLGHEFVGLIEAADEPGLAGRKIVSDINCACHACPVCDTGNPHHCPNRTTAGIRGKDGVFAQFINLPVRNLVTVNDTLPLECAVFAEPVAAALEIMEQVQCRPGEKVLVIGDGKLGLLICMCLAAHGMDVSLLGHHPENQHVLQGFHVDFFTESPAVKYPLVVEATGNPGGFKTAIQLTAPRGTLVLKSTIAGGFMFDSTSVVVDEITIIGSRCGPMAKAVRLIESGRIQPQRLIHESVVFSDAVTAVERARTRGTLKVLLDLQGA